MAFGTVTDIYRGFSIAKNDEGFWFADARGEDHGPYPTDEEAMNAIDAHRRELAAIGAPPSYK